MLDCEGEESERGLVRILLSRRDDSAPFHVTEARRGASLSGLADATGNSVAFLVLASLQ